MGQRVCRLLRKTNWGERPVKYILALLLLTFALPAQAQTVTTDKVQIIFYVKEGTTSPYQGLLQMPLEDLSKIDPDELQKRQLAQHAAWKVTTEAARSVVVKEPTADEKADEAKALQAQADELTARIAVIKSDPAVAAKLEAKR